MNTRKLALRPIFLFTVFKALFVVTSEAATLSSNCASTLKLIKEGPFFSSGTENSDIRFSQDGVYEILAPLPDSILEAVADSNYSSGPIDSITRSDLYPYISALNELIRLPSLQAEMKKQIRALLNDRQEAASKNAKMREEVKNTKSLLSVKEFTLERPPELVRFLDGEGEFILGHRAEGQSDESSENSVSVIDFRKPFSRFLKIYMKGNHEQLLLPVTFTTEEIGGLIFQQADFLTYSLPLTSYKVFSNIPFNITADIIRKLLSAPNPPDDSYLIVQQEAASKFAGAPFGKETLFSVLIKPWYELAITYNFKRSDFMPEPNVNIVLLQIKKRPNPLIITNESQQYKDFVVFAFNRSNPNLKKGLQHIFTSTQLTQIARNLRFEPSITPTKLTFDQWLGLFQAFVALVDSRKKQIVSGSEAKMRKEQSELDKVHRTRASKNWKSEGLI
jgi:23S rRNA (adenine-N6)-dimethyltransferase